MRYVLRCLAVLVACWLALFSGSALAVLADCTTNVHQYSNGGWSVDASGNRSAFAYFTTMDAACAYDAGSWTYTVNGQMCVETDGAGNWYSDYWPDSCVAGDLTAQVSAGVTASTSSGSSGTVSLSPGGTVTAVITPISQDDYDAANVIFGVALGALVAVWGGLQIYRFFSRSADA